MLPSNRRSVSDITATFESKLNPPSAFTTARPGIQANMSLSKRCTLAQQALPPSIDTVLDKAAAVLPLAPATAQPTRKPSWIGPKPSARAPSPTSAAMKHPVMIEFTSPGLLPPVFICTNLSSPPWEPIEMGSSLTANGEHRFSLAFSAEEGEYQYKLRLGPGDWWVCDESKPKVDDGTGNENNLVVVKPETVAVREMDERELERTETMDRHPAPLMTHETNTQPNPRLDDSAPPTVDQDDLESDHGIPLLQHETFALPPENAEMGSEHECPPLLHHETASPTSHEQEQSPRFRHESISTDHTRTNNHHCHAHSSRHNCNERRHSASSIPEEADPNDPSLEPFPTDHKGIMEHLDRTRKALDEDAFSDHGYSLSRSPAGPPIANDSHSLPSLAEGEDEADEESGKTAGELLQIRHIVEPSDVSAAPLTPPLTPGSGDDEEAPVEQYFTIPKAFEDIKVTDSTKAPQTRIGGLSSTAISIAYAIAAASAFLVMWYIRVRSDDIVI